MASEKWMGRPAQYIDCFVFEMQPFYQLWWLLRQKKPDLWLWLEEMVQTFTELWLGTRNWWVTFTLIMYFGFMFGQSRWLCASLCFPTGQDQRRWRGAEVWQAHAAKPGCEAAPFRRLPWEYILWMAETNMVIVLSIEKTLLDFSDLQCF